VVLPAPTPIPSCIDRNQTVDAADVLRPSRYLAGPGRLAERAPKTWLWIRQRLVGDEYQTRLTFVAAVAAAAGALHSATISLTGPLTDGSPGPCSVGVFLTFSFSLMSSVHVRYMLSSVRLSVVYLLSVVCRL